MGLECKLCYEACKPVLYSSLATAADLTPDNPYCVLAAGTINIELGTTTHTDICEHSYMADGWHRIYRLSQMLECTDTKDRRLINDMDFLQTHEFIVTSAILAPSTNVLIFRIWLVPYDLPNVQGRLRRRHETKILAPARKAMRRLIPLINQDPAIWSGKLTSLNAFKPLLVNKPVRVLQLSSCCNSNCQLGQSHHG